MNFGLIFYNNFKVLMMLLHWKMFGYVSCNGIISRRAEFSFQLTLKTCLMTIIAAQIKVSWHSELNLSEIGLNFMIVCCSYGTSTFAWNTVLTAHRVEASKKIHGYLTRRSLTCISYRPLHGSLSVSRQSLLSVWTFAQTSYNSHSYFNQICSLLLILVLLKLTRSSAVAVIADSTAYDVRYTGKLSNRFRLQANGW